MLFSSISAVVMDMDGVLWRGDDALPGLVELFDWLNERRLPYALATNNSSRSQADYAAKLARLGVPGVPESRIITSATATADYMGVTYPAGTRVYVVGGSGLRSALDRSGFDLSDDESDPPRVVVAGLDPDLTYARLKRAALLIRAGADFIGSNPDKTYPAPEGLIPGAGSLIAALEAATDQTATIIGKPGQPMFQAALKVVGASPGSTLMIGDRLNTDIKGAQDAGLKTCLVFTGVTTREELAEGEIWPDAAYDDLPGLLAAWAGDDWYRQKVKSRRAR